MELRPRHYYAQIKGLPRKEWKEAILNKVPEHYREWVRAYLKAMIMQAKAKAFIEQAPARRRKEVGDARKEFKSMVTKKD